jgi:hypothetical protein
MRRRRRRRHTASLQLLHSWIITAGNAFGLLQMS